MVKKLENPWKGIVKNKIMIKNKNKIPSKTFPLRTFKKKNKIVMKKMKNNENLNFLQF